MSHADEAGIEQRDGQDIWTRLQAYCAQGHLLRYPPLTEAQARALERTTGIYLSPEMQPLYTPIPHGFMKRPQLTLHPPATEEQLRTTEERLGFPLPADLRLLYTLIGNGGLHLGPCQTFYGASGDGEDAGAQSNGPDRPTIEELVSDSGWRLHPRLEEALLRHTDRYVVVDSLPDRFLWIAADSEIWIALDPLTGLVYSSDGWGYLPDNALGGAFDLITLEVAAPSLGVWFEQWLDETRRTPPCAGELLPEQVEIADLADPEVVWRGVYRFGPDWQLRPPDETDATDDLFFDPDDIG